MSEFKKQLTEREEDRRLLFHQQREIHEAYKAEQKALQQAQADAYTQALKHCGLI
jgi:hypothetical protein